MADLFDIKLPKWPQMYVTGEPISVDLAKEIIRRTDVFFTLYRCGSDPSFIDKVIKTLNIPSIEMGCSDHRWDEYVESKIIWSKKWSAINTEFVFNDWVSSIFIYGPHGWCHPDGSIGFIDNVGKRPTVKKVYEDWVILAKEFPFLNIDVSLMKDEACSHVNEPLVSMLVRNGCVDLCKPNPNLHKDHPKPKRNDVAMDKYNYPVTKDGVPWAWIKEWQQYT